jgi:CRP-like cAMP-binding protein
VLKLSKIFAGLSGESISDFVSCGEFLTFLPDEILLEEGEPGQDLYLILRGSVMVFLPRHKQESDFDRGTKIILGKLFQGDCFGEYSLIDDKPVSASVVTLENCEILKISKQDLMDRIDADAECGKTIFRNMLRVLVDRARQYAVELDKFCILC